MFQSYFVIIYEFLVRFLSIFTNDHLEIPEFRFINISKYFIYFYKQIQQALYRIDHPMPAVFVLRIPPGKLPVQPRFCQSAPGLAVGNNASTVRISGQFRTQADTVEAVGEQMIFYRNAVGAHTHDK